MSVVVDSKNLNEEEMDSDITSEDSVPAPKIPRKYKKVRAKVEKDWSHENIVKLINAVEERRTMWDFSSPHYKLPKGPSWVEVSECIGDDYTPEECKAKWYNLRVTFKTNIAKRRSSNSSIVWKYFNSMMFLENNDTAHSMESTSSMNIIPTSSQNIELQPPLAGQRRRRLQTDPSPTPKADFKEMAAKALENISEVDSFGALGNYIAEELRELLPHQARFAKRKLTLAFADILEEASSFQSPPQKQAKKVNISCTGTLTYYDT